MSWEDPIALLLQRRCEQAASRLLPFSWLREDFAHAFAQGEAKSVHFVRDGVALRDVVSSIIPALLPPASVEDNKREIANLIVEGSWHEFAEDRRDGRERLGLYRVPDRAEVSVLRVGECLYVQFREEGLLEALLLRQRAEQTPFKIEDSCRATALRLKNETRRCDFREIGDYYRESLRGDSGIPLHNLYFVSPQLSLAAVAATILDREENRSDASSVPDGLLATRQVTLGDHHCYFAAQRPIPSIGIDIVPGDARCRVICESRNVFLQLESSRTWSAILRRQQEIGSSTRDHRWPIRHSVGLDMEP